MTLPGDAMTYTVLAAAALSLGTLFQLFQRHIDGRPLLEAEPRRPVPWNFMAPLILLAPMLLLVLGGAETPALPEEPEVTTTAAAMSAALGAAGAPSAAWFSGAATTTMAIEHAFYGISPEAMATGMWLTAVTTVAMTAACFVLLILAFGATRADLGLPAGWSQAIGDVKIGAATWAASLVPIYAVLIVLSVIFEPTTQHPIVERLLENHSFWMMSGAAFSTVVAAPLYEEVAFRLVLQGWLERVGAAASTEIAEPLVDGSEEEPAIWSVPTRTEWAPIVISGTLFGLAHWGHGVSPAPLILLGFILGYVYQRTHRIVPCIVCHACFNAFTFVLLGLQFAAAG